MKAHLVCEVGDEIVGNKASLIAQYMHGAFDERPEQESFFVVFLNRKNKIIGRHLLTIGTETAALASPMCVLRAVLRSSAIAFACVHNHPSGDPAPSCADIQVTRCIREAAKACEVCFLDHVIIGTANSDPLMKGYYSFREAGLI